MIYKTPYFAKHPHTSISVMYPLPLTQVRVNLLELSDYMVVTFAALLCRDMPLRGKLSLMHEHQPPEQSPIHL